MSRVEINLGAFYIKIILTKYYFFDLILHRRLVMRKRERWDIVPRDIIGLLMFMLMYLFGGVVIVFEGLELTDESVGVLGWGIVFVGVFSMLALGWIKEIKRPTGGAIRQGDRVCIEHWPDQVVLDGVLLDFEEAEGQSDWLPTMAVVMAKRSVIRLPTDILIKRVK
jgi:hypothetical protein